MATSIEQVTFLINDGSVGLRDLDRRDVVDVDVNCS
jgi:hypothetical protein